MNGRHNHRTLGQAPHSAAVYLTLNAEHSSVIYRWPTSGDHCHILLGVHNDHIDDGDKDGEDDVMMTTVTITTTTTTTTMMTAMMMMMKK